MSREESTCVTVEQPKFQVNCSVCNQIMKSPMSCLVCMTSFCAKCSTMCQKCDVALQANIILQQKIALIQVRCSVCDLVSSFSAWESHQCKYLCLKGCETEIFKSEEDNHARVCPKEMITCPGCQETGERAHIQTKHLDNCCAALKLKLQQEMLMKQKLASEFATACEEQQIMRLSLLNLRPDDQKEANTDKFCLGKIKGCDFYTKCATALQKHEDLCASHWKVKLEEEKKKVETLTTEFATATAAKEKVKTNCERRATNLQNTVNQRVKATQQGFCEINSLEFVKVLCTKANDGYQFACNDYYNEGCSDPQALKTLDTVGVGLKSSGDCWMTFTFPNAIDIKYLILGEPRGTSGGWGASYLSGAEILLDGTLAGTVFATNYSILFPVLKKVKEIRIRKAGYFALGFFKAIV